MLALPILGPIEQQGFMLMLTRRHIFTKYPVDLINVYQFELTVSFI